MHLYLKILGEDKQIVIKPENESDRKLLEFLSAHKTAKIITETEYRYTGNTIESINIKLLDEPICNQDNS